MPQGWNLQRYINMEVNVDRLTLPINLWGNIQSFTIKYNVSWRVFVWVLYIQSFKLSSPHSYFEESFYINRWWVLTNELVGSIDRIWYFIFRCYKMYIMLVFFKCYKSKIEPAWLWSISTLVCGWNWLLILIKSFADLSVWTIVL